MKILLITALCFLSLSFTNAQVQYPAPTHTIELQLEGQTARMVFMDINPGNKKNIVLLHGKNFSGYYWHNLIPFLTKLGYRIIVPDQLGFGRSDRPVIHYSFHMLASNTRQLLDSLNIRKTVIMGHSMGGMLAARFTLMYPERVEKLILENPIGLEDYRRFIPYQPFDSVVKKEKKATYASYKNYQMTYYPEWKMEYEQYVAAQAGELQTYDTTTRTSVNALTYLMIYEQPVVYEFSDIKLPTLLIIGQLDRTVVGKDQLKPGEKNKYGQYPQLGKLLNKQIKGSLLKEISGAGHIPHIQTPELFIDIIKPFLK